MHRLIVGRSNSGKSALAKQIGSDLRLRKQEVLAYSPIGERGYTRLDDYGCAGADWESDDADEFADEVLTRINRDTRKRFLIIDEAHEFFTRKGCANLWLGTKGRHYGLNIIAITQRAAIINPTFRCQCSTVYIFQCSLTDAKFLADDFGKPKIADVINFPRGEFIKIENDTLTRHKIF